MSNGEMGWTPVVRMRRKKSAKSKESDSSEKFNVMMNLNKGRSLVWYKKVGRNLEFLSIDSCKLQDGWQPVENTCGGSDGLSILKIKLLLASNTDSRIS